MMQPQQIELIRLNSISNGARRQRRAHCMSRYQIMAGVPSVSRTFRMAVRPVLS